MAIGNVELMQEYFPIHKFFKKKPIEYASGSWLMLEFSLGLTIGNVGND